MTNIARGQHPIEDTEDYVGWANTLDSAGQDSGPARERMQSRAFQRELLDTARDVVRASERMDVLKKYVYYGRDPKVPFQEPMSEYSPNWSQRLNEHDTCTLFHAICGWVTESGELMKMFIECLLQGQPFNRENVIEEVGDGSWYTALFAKWLGWGSLIPIFRGNYNKLIERYGKQWSQKGALERDTNAEMQAMASAIAHRNDGATIITVKRFDDTSQYNTLEEIVGQLSFVDYKDEHGHELVNNAAFVSLLQMAAGLKAPYVKAPVPGGTGRPYSLRTPHGFTDLIPHDAGAEVQDAAVAKKMLEHRMARCICYHGSWNDQCPAHKCLGDLLADEEEGQNATGSNNQ
jgi:hypothetical protein